MRHVFRLVTLLPLVSLAQANPLRGYFPYGVYADGNSPDGRVKVEDGKAGVRASIESACKDLAAHNMNAVWPHNLPQENIPIWLEMAEKYGLRIVPQSGGPPTFVRGSFYKDKNDLVSRVTNGYKGLTDAYGKHPALLAWSIGEESKPERWVFEGVAEVTRRMAMWDPQHPAIMLDNNATSAAISAEIVRPRGMAMDSYVFFADPKSGPSTPSASRSLWTRQCGRMKEISASIDAPYWMMAQAMELWDMRGEKPAHKIWERPTVAQLRWQVWSAVQRGATGIFFFIYHGPFRGPGGTGESMIGLIDEHGRETPLYREAAMIGAKLKTLAPIFLQLRPVPVDKEVEWEDSVVSARTHRHSVTGRRYVSMVNNDWDQAQPMAVALGYFPGTIDKTEKLYNLESGKAYDAADSLGPGDVALFFVGTEEGWTAFRKDEGK